MKKHLCLAVLLTIVASPVFAEKARKPSSTLPAGKWECSDDNGNHNVKIRGGAPYSPAGSKILSDRANGDATYTVEVEFRDGSKAEVVCQQPGVD